MSPTPGRSTLITSAPNQASSCVQVGPDCTCVKSRMLHAVERLAGLAERLLRGRRQCRSPPAFFAAAGALAVAFDRLGGTPSSARLLRRLWRLRLGLCLLRSSLLRLPAACHIVPAQFPLRRVESLRTRLLLLQRALRIEVADAAALAAGRRIDHRVDERRLAGVHRRVDGALAARRATSR